MVVDMADEAKKSRLKGLKAEFKKITWPDKESAFKQSVVGVLIALMDYAIQFGVNFITSI